MITRLEERAAGLPAELRGAFGRIFAVDSSVGRLELTEAMRPWVGRQFGADADMEAQTVVTVLNRLTLEGALFNPLRARRPAAAGSDETLEDWIAQELAADSFADPLRDTPPDLFGRIAGRHCVSASNIAKCAGWHGLVIFREPHPLRFGRAELRDYLDVARRWLAAAHARDPRALHPIVIWNCLPKSGATIMHGHMQILLARLPPARAELWRRAAATYRADSGRAYLDDLAAVHRALGLGLPAAPGLAAFAHLTPLRNREIVALAPPGAPPDALADTLCDLLRALIDRRGLRAFNLALTLPPLAPAPGWEGWPAVARLADRGAPVTSRGDLGAIELFGTGCVTADPFEVAAQLQADLAPPAGPGRPRG